MGNSRAGRGSGNLGNAYRESGFWDSIETKKNDDTSSKGLAKVNATLNYELNVERPYCTHTFDVINDEYSDCDSRYSKPLFNNKWDGIGITQTCPECVRDFEVESIEY